MKYLQFVLGLLVGILSTYLVLTRFWWPDVRLQAAREVPGQLPGPASPPSASVEPASPSIDPQALATPETATGAIPESWPEPAIAQLTPSPVASASPAMSAPPIETKTIELPLLETDVDRLRERSLAVPVQGVQNKALHNTFKDSRGDRVHEAMDIMAPRGTPVVAVDDGRVEKLFTSKQGGLTIYQFDPSGEYCYYYAHLDRYAADIGAGRVLRKGEVIGYVGSTGNASPEGPHLHFSIFRLGVEKRWWEGTAINPFPLWETLAAGAPLPVRP